MKANKILVYDDYCPLCTWYSDLFVKYKFIEAENRVPFSTVKPEILNAIDVDKAKDEIPLFDDETKETQYGIDALLAILGQRWPAIKSIGNHTGAKFFLKRLYKLVSYNRKVIVAKRCGDGRFDCSPGFNIFYRILFMALFFLFNSSMLYPLHYNLFTHVSFYHLSFYQLQLSHMTLVGINCFLAMCLTPPQSIEYLGQVNMLALVTILLLVPIMVISIAASLEWLILAYFIFLTAFVIREYFRRMTYANITREHNGIVAINFVCLIIFLAYVFH